MEAIDIGELSLLPPTIAIVFRLMTKEVISSLIVGILSGTLIYAFNTGGGIVKAVYVTFTLMAEKLGANASIILFLGFLGALVAVITMAGGSKAYGDARKFDDDLPIGDIMQAMRNVWISNALQLLFGKEVYYSKANFAYSMLYPYTDNY